MVLRFKWYLRFSLASTLTVRTVTETTCNKQFKNELRKSFCLSAIASSVIALRHLLNILTPLEWCALIERLRKTVSKTSCYAVTPLSHAAQSTGNGLLHETQRRLLLKPRVDRLLAISTWLELDYCLMQLRA